MRQVAWLIAGLLGTLPVLASPSHTQQATSPLQVALASFAVAGDTKAAVVVALDLRQPAIAVAPGNAVSDTLDVVTSASGPGGDSRGSQRDSVSVVFQPGPGQMLRAQAVVRMDLPPGAYHMQVVAHGTASGFNASAVADVDVPDYSRRSFSMSGMMLSTASSSAPAQSGLKNLLSRVPTANREFLATDRITALASLYQDGSDTSGSVTMTTRIVDDHDQIRIAAPNVISLDRFVVLAAPEQKAGAPDPLMSGRTELPPGFSSRSGTGLRYAELTYDVPSDRLGAGQYVLAFEAVKGRFTERRQVRFTIR